MAYLRALLIITVVFNGEIWAVEDTTAGEFLLEPPSPHCPLNAGTSCHCDEYQGGHDLWCPSRNRHRLRIHYQPLQVWLICNHEQQMTVADIIFELRNVTIGPLDSLVHQVG